MWPLLAVLAAIHLMIPLLNHYNFRTFGFDYAIYNYAFYDYAHFRITPCPVYLTLFPITFLQDHFSLLLMFLAPLYWVLTPIFETFTLLIIQWGLIVWGGWATYKLIEIKTEKAWMALLAMFYYFILFGRFTLYQGDCNLAVMGSALVAVFFYFFETRRFLLSMIFFLVILVSREDFPLWMIFIGIFLWIVHRKDKQKAKFSFAIVIASVFSFVIFFSWVIPALETDEKKFSLFNYAVLGNTPGDAIRFVITHPLKAIQLLFVNHSGDTSHDGVKLSFYIVYGLSGGLLLFYRPSWLIVLIPLLAKKMYNDNPVRWGNELYYSIELATLLPIMVFLVINEFKGIWKPIAAALVCVMALSVTLYFGAHSNYWKYNFFDANFFRSNYPVKDIYKAMSLIPQDARVCASSRIVTHLSNRENAYYFPNIRDAEYVCIYRKGDTFPVTQEEFDRKTNEMLESGKYEVLVDSENFLMVKLKSNP